MIIITVIIIVIIITIFLQNHFDFTISKLLVGNVILLLTTYGFLLCLVTGLTVKDTHSVFIHRISNLVQSPGEGDQLLS